MMIEFFGNVDATSNIYINEQTTPLFNFLQKSYPRIVGSEFLGDTYGSGSINVLGFRHEDATALSFETESQHLVLSFEVLEHIPNYQLAVKEAHRILRNGGALILTAPFVEANVKNIQRAIVTDKGNIVHFEEPEYHGDPVSSDGILASITLDGNCLMTFVRPGLPTLDC